MHYGQPIPIKKEHKWCVKIIAFIVGITTQNQRSEL
jgi:hypothetical protein